MRGLDGSLDPWASFKYFWPFTIQALKTLLLCVKILKMSWVLIHTCKEYILVLAPAACTKIEVIQRLAWPCARMTCENVKRTMFFDVIWTYCNDHLYLHISNHYLEHRKQIQSYMSIISNKTGGKYILSMSRHWRPSRIYLMFSILLM